MDNYSKDKKPYEAPRLTVVSFRVEQGYALSGLTNVFLLSDAWSDKGGDAWGGSGLSNGSSFGGWEDVGGSAWD